MCEMKKIIFSLLIVCIILITNFSYAETRKATVKVAAVRIREAASTDSNIITNIYEDDEVTILEENGEWYKVQYGSSVGFAKAEFFKVEQTKQPVATAQETEKNSPSNAEEKNTTNVQNVLPEQPISQAENVENVNVGQKVVLPNAVSLRRLPNFSSHANQTAAQGTEMTVEQKIGNWYKITNETISGWTTKSKIISQTPVAQIPTTPEVPQPVVQQPEPPKPEEPQNTTPAEPVVPSQPENPKPATNTTSENNTIQRKAVVIVETARVRKAATKNSDIVDTLDEDDIVTIVAEENGFYKITTSSIKEGYVSKTLVKEKDVTSRGMTEERENTVSEQTQQEPVATPSVAGADVVTFAKQYLGYPYVLGKSSPESGFDCSGFTRYVFGHFGYSLGQVAASQTSLGTPVDRVNLQMGDLILFYDDGKTKIGHCGIYIQGGDFIHSANPQRGVVIDNLNTNSYYSQRFVTARRIAGG